MLASTMSLTMPVSYWLRNNYSTSSGCKVGAFSCENKAIVAQFVVFWKIMLKCKFMVKVLTIKNKCDIIRAMMELIHHRAVLQFLP